MKKSTILILTSIIVLCVAAFGILWTMLPAPVDEMSLRIYADPMTEQLLLAINDGNYTQFLTNLDQSMLSHFSYANFTQLCDLLQQKVGNYTSKQFIKAESQNGFISVYYSAMYTLEPANVTVKVVFSSDDGPAKISGLWFNSPRLAQ